MCTFACILCELGPRWKRETLEFFFQGGRNVKNLYSVWSGQVKKRAALIQFFFLRMTLHVSTLYCVSCIQIQVIHDRTERVSLRDLDYRLNLEIILAYRGLWGSSSVSAVGEESAPQVQTVLRVKERSKCTN